MSTSHDDYSSRDKTNSGPITGNTPVVLEYDSNTPRSLLANAAHHLHLVCLLVLSLHLQYLSVIKKIKKLGINFFYVLLQQYSSNSFSWTDNSF